jgi:hypothetical protein
VTDVNDNQPKIEVSFLNQSEPGISESAQIGSFVAFVSVTDQDDSANQNSRPIRTELIDQSKTFELEIVDRDSNRFILRTNQKLDRERISSYQISIIAYDHSATGTNNSGKTEKKIIIPIFDENDNTPYFSHAMYHITLDENNRAGEPITTLRATDLDNQENSRIRYFLSEKSNFFAIDQSTGEIRSLKKFDAETDQSEMILKIEARDSGNPPLIGRCQVTITINDLNDNRPIFDRSEYEFTIEENGSANHVIGSVKARDSDRNALIGYRFAVENDKFYVDRTTGVIYLTRPLDYEEDQSTYSLTILAEDRSLSKGEGPSTAKVIIRLLDRNDHTPKITWPLPHADIVPIEMTGVKGELIATLQAMDGDQGHFGKVEFETEFGFDLVELNQLNGELRLARDVTQSDAGHHPILVKIKDQGQPALFSTSRVRIFAHSVFYKGYIFRFKPI